MNLSQNFNRECKPIFLAVAIHLAIFASIFSFTSASVDISNYATAGSFTMTAFFAKEEGVLEKRATATPKNHAIANKSQNIQQNNSQQNNSDSSSEIIYNAQNLGNPQPQYPLLSKRRGEEGVVLIRAFVDETGAASKVEIFKSSSFALLDNAAVEAIKKWRFAPATKLGQYIASSVIIPINFKLTQNS
jgi:TonB family protein